MSSRRGLDCTGMAPGGASQGSRKEDVAMIKQREVSGCVPSSTEQVALCDAPKPLGTSACKDSLRVVEAVSKEAQLSEIVSVGKMPFGKKAALEVTCVRQLKKGVTQSGIMDFLMVQDKKQDFKQDKSMNGGSLKGSKMQMNADTELHRNTRIRKPLNEKEDNSLASTLHLPSANFECEGYALTKEGDQKLSLLNPTGFNYNQESELIQSDFFLPASKKCRSQRSQEAANVSIPDCTRASKRDSVGLKRCMPNNVKEVLIAEATSRSKLIILKQPRRNEDFFRPASKKQKQTTNKEVPMKIEGVTKAEVGDQKHFEFDLHMEAKFAAEENAQLCAGKPTHPFFSQHNIGYRACTFWDASFTSAALISEVEDLAPAPPFHINQLDKDCEAGSQTASFALSFFETKKDQLVFKAGFSANSMEKLEKLLKRPSLGLSCKTTRWFPQSVGKERLVEQLEDKIWKWRDIEKESRHDEKGEEDQFAFTEAGLEERLKLCCADHAKECSRVCLDLTSGCTAAGSTSRNLLWTDAYQPQLPEQVCGNKGSVKSLSEWLQNWQIRCTSSAGCSEGAMFHRTVANCGHCDEDKGWSDKDLDGGENTSNDYFLPNVLVLAGPVGCGKTAAIYACAKAHGYTVIEVNCSENRSGTLIKQKFGEATESHRVGKWSADATIVPLTKRHYCAKSNACKGNTFVIEAKKAELADGKKNSSDAAANKDLSESKLPFRCTHLTSEAQQLRENDESGDNKETTILLFEDVDVVFEDDRGFMAAVVQVATSAKRPIILTSNDKELCLPHNLCSHLLEFNQPSTEDLMSLAYMVCVAEGVVCTPEFLRKVINVCNHDARKMLNYLQFWCQGKFSAGPQHTELEKDIAKVGKDEKEFEIPSSVRLHERDSAAITYLFDLEAQYGLRPACIDLGFPCEVTKSISGKLSETVREAETKHRVHKEKKLVQEVIKKRVLLDKKKRRMIDSCPNVGFNPPCEHEGEDITDETSSAEELSFSTAPVQGLEAEVRSPVLKRKSRRQLAIVMSESDDDAPGVTQRHEDEQHSHVGPEPLSYLTYLRTSREMGSINGENAPVLSGLYAKGSTMNADTNSDATQTFEIAYSEKFQSSASRCPLEELGSDQTAPCSFSDTLEPVYNLWEPVYNLWSYFQTCSKNKDEFLLSPASKESLSVVLSFSDLLDNLSACDIMSCVHSRKQDVTNETSHENPECCDWSPFCAQIAHESFQMCLQDSRNVAGFICEGRGAISLEDMMLAVNDPPMLTKLPPDEKLNHQRGTFCGQAGPLCEEQDLIRLQKVSSLQNNILIELPPTVQRSFQGAAFYEHLSFLARMGHLEQDRLAIGLTTRPRARGSQSLFCGHPWYLSENSITILQSFGNFGRQSSVK